LEANMAGNMHDAFMGEVPRGILTIRH